MRACLYSPYFGSTYGGGEKYLAATARVIRDHVLQASVEILAPTAVDRGRYETMLGIDLEGIGLPSGAQGPGSLKRRLARFGPLRPIRDLALTVQTVRRAAGCDLFANMVYRLPPFATGRRTVLLVQFPHRLRLIDHLAAQLADGGVESCAAVICQSDYVRRWTERLWGVNAAVVYPPVEIPAAEPDLARKEPVILTVGRFVAAGHHKRHDVLVQAFRRLVDSGLEGWRLVVAGSVQRDDQEDLAYLRRVRNLAEGYPIDVRPDIMNSDLRDLYRQASIYWHAAGYGVDEAADPAAVEHFGMTTVEAMGHGAVPVVILAGGQPEIVEDGISGQLWTEVRELEEKTLRLAGDAALRTRLALNARERSRRYSVEAFETRMRAALKPIVAELSH